MTTKVAGQMTRGVTRYVGSVAELEALSSPVGEAVYLAEEGRAGEGVIKSGSHPSDPQKGIYIDLANGNYWERLQKYPVKASWFGAVYDDVTDSTTAVEAAEDYLMSLGGGVIIHPSGDLRVSRLTLKRRIFHIGQGRSTTIRCLSSASPFIDLDDGPVQYAGYANLRITGSESASPTTAINSGQWAFSLEAVADGTSTGGWWYGTMINVQVDGFDNGMDLVAGDDFLLPHQFLVWQNFNIIRNDAGGKCLRMENQVEQIDSSRCVFDAVSGTTTGTNIELVAGTTTRPRGLTFIRPTIQNCLNALSSSGSDDVSFMDGWYENIAEFLTLTGANNNFKIGGRFANAANGGGTGYIVSGGGTGNVEFLPSRIAGTCDKIVSAVSTVYVDAKRISGSSNATTISDSGAITKQISESAGVLTCGMGQTFLVNSSATEITTINSNLMPGEFIFLKPLGGSISLNNTGNIRLGAASSPLTIPQNEVVQLVRYDITGEWQVVGK